MTRSRAFTAGIFAAVLLVVLVANTATAQPAPDAATTAKCEAAQSTLPTNPDVAAFKECAAIKPISASCCRKLLPFAQYYDCLSVPSYKAEVDKFLAGVTTVDEVQSACLS